MDTSKKISKLLQLATHALTETGHLYKDVEGLDREKSLKALGTTLVSIAVIRDSISALHPELASDIWVLINQNESAFKAEETLMQEAENAEQSGNISLAIELYKTIEAQSKIRDYRIYAQSGLYRVGASKSSHG